MDITLVSQVLKELLKSRSPEFGARLKQRLNVVLRERSMQPFDEKALGFRKFTDFLSKTQSTWLQIDRVDDSSDVRVSLRTPDAAASVAAIEPAAPSFDQDPIRSDIWQAFVNRVGTRKRFLNKATYAVERFTANELAGKGGADEYLEILPFTDETHVAWMNEFLDAHSIHGAEREPLTAMLTGTYTSKLNTAFTHALGAKGDPWRGFRSQKIADAIRRWATEKGVPEVHLCKAAPLAPAKPTSKDGTRAKVARLLQLISDEDLERVVVPVLVSTILLRNGS